MSSGSVAFGRECVERGLSDAAFLAQVRWIPARSIDDLQQVVAAGRIDKFWRTWSKSVIGRADRKLRQRRIANQCALWPWSDSREHPAKVIWTLIEKADWVKLSRWARQQLSNSDAWTEDNTAFQLLALAEVLLSGELVDAEVALPVWRLALTWAIELSVHQCEPEGCELSPDQRLLLCGELPWALGQIFADIDGVTEFKQLGQQSLRNELIELTDGDGTPAVSLLAHFPRWLSSLTRSVELGVIFGESLLEGESLLRFEDVLTKAVMLLDRDGHMLISTDGRSVTSKRAAPVASAASSTVAMLLRAAELAGLKETSLAAESLRFREFVARYGSSDKFKSDTFAESPDERPIVTDSDLPALQSDWAAWVCMRNWWHADANTIKLTQASSSEGLYAPVVIDWSPKRAAREAEWRTLTVTEERRKLASWEAAGHRLRLGDLHLVLFRSLDGSTESRAVLGLHTNKESVIAQFNEKGYVLPIVSVEA